MNKLGIYINPKTSLMKRVFIFIICFHVFLCPIVYDQIIATQAGLSLDSYELPTTQNDFTNSSTSSYYQVVIGEQKSMPTLALNKQRLKKDKILSLFANTLLLLSASNQSNNLGAVGLPNPAFNPLITDLSGPNDYLLLQQYETRRNNILPNFITAPKVLQLRF